MEKITYDDRGDMHYVPPLAMLLLRGYLDPGTLERDTGHVEICTLFAVWSLTLQFLKYYSMDSTSTV